MRTPVTGSIGRCVRTFSRGHEHPSRITGARFVAAEEFSRPCVPQRASKVGFGEQSPVCDPPLPRPVGRPAASAGHRLSIGRRTRTFSPSCATAGSEVAFGEQTPVCDPVCRAPRGPHALDRSLHATLHRMAARITGARFVAAGELSRPCVPQRAWRSALANNHPSVIHRFAPPSGSTRMRARVTGSIGRAPTFSRGHRHRARVTGARFVAVGELSRPCVPHRGWRSALANNHPCVIHRFPSPSPLGARSKPQAARGPSRSRRPWAGTCARRPCGLRCGCRRWGRRARR
jgi:hypothetical protein